MKSLTYGHRANKTGSKQIKWVFPNQNFMSTSEFWANVIESLASIIK